MTAGTAILRGARRRRAYLLGVPASLAVVAVAPVAALAAATLWYPDHGDQALFVVGARSLDEGAVYYRDFWDIKQPGIYWLYQLGDLFGLGGLGARLIEIVLAVVAAVLVLAVTSGWPLRRGVRLAAPTLVLGPYLLWSYLAGVGQIEGIMNVLLLTVLAAAWPPGPTRLRSAGAFAVAGAALGVIAVLKTLYVPYAALPVLVALVLAARLDRRAASLRLLTVVAGFAVPVAGALAYFAAHGAMDLALQTTFAVPSQVAANPNTHLAGSLAEYQRAANNLFPLTGPLALLGLLGARRRASLLRDGTLAAVALLGAALALPQLWTPYRFLMLATPVGLLALLGLQSLVDWLARRVRARLLLQALAAAAVVGLAVVSFRYPAKAVSAALRTSWGLDVVSRVERSDEPVPTAAQRIAAAVANRVAPREQVYVFGDPIVMELLDARQGAEITGWSIEMLPTSLVRELARELERSRPAFIFVDPMYQELLTSEAGGVLQGVLTRHYHLLWSGPEGRWYQTDQVGTPLPAPDGGVRLP